MKKSTVIGLLSLIGLYLLVYVCVTILQERAAGYFLAPIGTFSAFAVILFVYIKNRKKDNKAVVWLFLSAALLFWTAANIVWMVAETGNGNNLSENLPALLLYEVPNLCALAAVVVFLIAQFKRWNRAKLVLDATMFSITSLLLVWILFFNRDITLLGVIFQDGPFSVINILVDVLIIILLAVWFMSVRSGNVPAFAMLTILGIVIFSLADMAYYYISYHGGYAPNSGLNAFYMLSAALVTAGGVLRLRKGTENTVPTGNLNGSRRGTLVKDSVILLLPLAAMAVVGFKVVELLLFLSALAVYKGLSVYVETAIKKEALLDKEKKLNEELGLLVSRHTQNLMEMNEELRRKNEELIFLSNRDTLTNLYNRRYMLEKLERGLSCVKPGKIVALLYIDMDRFKVINDTYGHEMGDKVLMEITERLKSFTDENAMLARVGGDEFVFVLTDLTDSQEAALKARKIIERCSHNIYIDDYVFAPSVCIGISVYPLDAENVGLMLKNADIALYHAKEQGAGRFAVFSRMIRQKTQRRNSIEILLRGDEILREFEVYYQPQFSIPDRKLIAAEALLRWRNPELGVISPVEFIPIAEETDCINKIGLWVLRQTVARAADWNRRFGGDLVIGVNISPKQLNSSKLLEELQNLAGGDFNPAWLDIEVTESVALEGEYRLAQIFNLFKSIGMSVSIDDFGAGYSSIMSLKQYSFDRVKIAKPMIDSITASERNEQIVRALVLMAKSIGMKTIAEGVETEAQLQKLSAIGCEQAQGYLLGEPMTAEDFEAKFLELLADS